MDDNQKYIGTRFKSFTFQTSPDCIFLVFEDSKNRCSHSVKFSFLKTHWETFSCWMSDKILGQIVTEASIIPNQLMSLKFANGYQIDFGEKETVENVVMLNEIYQKC